MDLHLFPLDTDTIDLTFFASNSFTRSGEINVNFKSDYRMLFEGWQAAPPNTAPYGWKLVSTKARPHKKPEFKFNKSEPIVL